VNPTRARAACARAKTGAKEAEEERKRRNTKTIRRRRELFPQISHDAPDWRMRRRETENLPERGREREKGIERRKGKGAVSAVVEEISR